MKEKVLLELQKIKEYMNADISFKKLSVFLLDEFYNCEKTYSYEFDKKWIIKERHGKEDSTTKTPIITTKLDFTVTISIDLYFSYILMDHLQNILINKFDLELKETHYGYAKLVDTGLNKHKTSVILHRNDIYTTKDFAYIDFEIVKTTLVNNSYF